MKILWVCNVPIPKIAQNMGIEVQNICGWLSGLANSIESNKEIELNICFPTKKVKVINKGSIGSISYYAFSQTKVLGVLPIENQLKVSKKTKSDIKEIIENVNPDILHIFGTEYPHSFTATKEFNNPSKTILHVQGLTSICAIHYNTGIPYYELKKFTFSNLLRGNFIKQANKFQKRGVFEIETIKVIKNIIGRTEWDYVCTKEINPSSKYYLCNESLRDSFYEGEWKYSNCERCSVFMSQAAYPIKGLHFMIRAMPDILKEYPDTHLYIAGNDLTKTDSIYEKLKISSYAQYIKRLIKKYNIDKHITFTGQLNEIQMKKYLLNTNAFASCSTIENSPNSLGEAMLLGVPCVSSDVGGVRSIMEHGKDGYTYQVDAPYMLAHYIKQIFGNQKKSEIMGKNAKLHAKNTHDRVENAKKLIEIYQEIYSYNI